MKSDCGLVEVCLIPDTDCDEDRAYEQYHPSGEVDARQNSCCKLRLTCLRPVTASISVSDSVSWYVVANDAFRSRSANRTCCVVVNGG